MYLLIGASVALFVFAVAIAVPGTADTYRAMPRRRCVQPQAGDGQAIVAREAVLSRDAAYLLARLGC